MKLLSQKYNGLLFGKGDKLIVSSLVRNFVPEKSRKSIMLRQTESSFEVLLNRHSYSNAQSASHLNTQADSLLSVLYKNPLRGKCRQQRSAFEFHGWAVQGCSCLKSCGRPVLRATSISMNLSITHWSISSRGSFAATKSSSLFSKKLVSFFLAIVFSFC